MTWDPFDVAYDGMFCDAFGMATDGYFCAPRRIIVGPGEWEGPRPDDGRDRKDIADILAMLAGAGLL